VSSIGGITTVKKVGLFKSIPFWDKSLLTDMLSLSNVSPAYASKQQGQIL
jgi:hypothetical protein